MKSIETLVPDIYKLVKSRGWFTDELRDAYAQDVGKKLQEKFNETYDQSRLRMSKLGPMCPKALWCSIHHPELADPLPPWTEIKYSIGHSIESQLISLAKAAGHTVEGEQDVVEFDGIVGHRDCVIDGMVIDVKSASPRAFEKFKNKQIEKEDAFGYLDQLDGYVLGSAMDPLVKVKDEGGLLVIDPILGHMVLYRHKVTHARSRTLRERIALYKRIVGSLVPPDCTCGTQPDGASGNIRLDTRSSYSPYKHFCNPGLRTFVYSKGPIYLTKVVRVPDVKEVKRLSRLQYH